VLSKPQIVATALKSRADIKTYVVQAGETIPALATRFGITSDSIRWSNGLSGDNLNVGTKLTIPPVSGIVYTVKAGDNGGVGDTAAADPVEEKLARGIPPKIGTGVGALFWHAVVP